MESIKTLAALSYNLSLGPGYDGYISLITSVDLTESELDHICEWRDDHYCRISVYDTPSLEALITCWKPGQRGPIHNNMHQQGWLKVLKGEIKLSYFHTSAGESPKAYNQMIIKQGESAYLNDTPGFHRLENISGEPCICVHFYSAKVTRWQEMDERTGEIRIREIGHDRSVLV